MSWIYPIIFPLTKKSLGYQPESVAVEQLMIKRETGIYSADQII